MGHDAPNVSAAFSPVQVPKLERLGTSSAMLSGDFNPDNPNPKDLEAFRMGVMELRSALNIHEQMDSGCAQRYAEALKP